MKITSTLGCGPFILREKAYDIDGIGGCANSTTGLEMTVKKGNYYAENLKTDAMPATSRLNMTLRQNKKGLQNFLYIKIHGAHVK
jgi:hypothetical protein